MGAYFLEYLTLACFLLRYLYLNQPAGQLAKTRVGRGYHGKRRQHRQAGIQRSGTPQIFTPFRRRAPQGNTLGA
jgi:hypothetical protein